MALPLVHSKSLLRKISPRLAGPLSAITLLLASTAPAMADGPGRGPTGAFEKSYLMYIIDHHYSALRMTELAAGTDRTRDATLNNPAEGTSPSPEFGTTPAKSGNAEIRSMARMENRAQREEINKAQDMLRQWYGMRHDPVLSHESRRMINMLEQAAPGMQFDATFLRTMSNHHFAALSPSLHCQVKSDLRHDGLRRYCDNIVTVQKNGINDMREMLCKMFGDCDFIPTAGKHREHF